ncbi:CLCA_X family protein [Marinomonas piezotolerans]|nr:CLCA_X family protein [Marinomonas piezotolerans]
MNYLFKGMMRQAHQALSFVDIRKHFNFKSIEMGRWVSSEERDRAAVQFYNALCDLQKILTAPELVISLRGSLGLQYGKGGRLGVSAHYVPALHTLSLAKNAGAGSLAHEWFHAFDHYMGEKMFPIADEMAFASKMWLSEYPTRQHPLNELLSECFSAIMLSIDGTQPSDLFQCSKQADERLGILYYSRPEELCARAFEAYIEDCTPNNRFLVSGTRSSDEAKLGLYPQGLQRQMINEMFQQYFGVLGEALYREA